MIYQDILQEGLEQSIEQKAQEIVVNMLNQEVAIALIVRVTGLTIQLQQLQAKTDDNQAQWNHLQIGDFS